MSGLTELPSIWDAERLVERFGAIPLDRICTDPAPGLATEEDVVWFDDEENRHYELVDGILVGKTVGYYESMLAMEIARVLGNFVKPGKLGIILGEGGTLKLAPGLVRVPDVCFIAKEKFPGGRFPKAKIPLLAPDLAVEVLSQSNTRQEMSEKLRDYFSAGTKLVWYVDPEKREVRVFTSPTESTLVNESGVLDGGDLLPGFTLSIRELFAELPGESEE